jgi:hypothetical protein
MLIILIFKKHILKSCFLLKKILSGYQMKFYNLMYLMTWDRFSFVNLKK